MQFIHSKSQSKNSLFEQQLVKAAFEKEKEIFFTSLDFGPNPNFLPR
jgi:hypothetical protein